MTIPGATYVDVVWHRADDGGERRTSRVALVDGETTADDIPAMLAAASTGRPADAASIVVERAERVE